MLGLGMFRRLRPYIEPLLYDKHLSLKEITFAGMPRIGSELCACS